MKEVKELWNLISVKEVVTKNGELIYTLERGDDSNDTRSAIENKERKEYKLNSICSISDTNWQNLIEGDTVSKQYDALGHTNVGKINIKLTQAIKSGETGLDQSPHKTSIVSDEAEKYMLTVTYVPTAKKNINYHTGSEITGNAGAVTNQINSKNTHIINVYAKGLQITKVDLNDVVLKGAKFALFRTARADETSDITINNKPFHSVAELDTGASGVASIDAIERLLPNEEYYLVETQAPAGYLMIEPIKVSLTIEDVYTPKPGSDTQETKPESGIYDWVQNSVLKLVVDSGVKRTDADNTDLTHTAIQANAVGDKAYYRIINNPGVELPHTGGIGTGVFKYCGLMLMAGSILYILSKRRSR